MRSRLTIAVLLLCVWLAVVNTASAATPKIEDGEQPVTHQQTNSPTPAQQKDQQKAAAQSPGLANNPATGEQLQQLNENVRKLMELVERQQREIERLQQTVSTLEKTNQSGNSATTQPVNSANPVTSPDPVSSASLSSTLPRPANNTATSPAAAPTNGALIKSALPAAEPAQKLASIDKAFSNMQFSGDLRFRYETLGGLGFDSPTELPDRTRLRMRVRLQLTGQIGKNFDYGIRLASGNFTNPLSVSPTATDFFNRKTIGLDRYYVRYTAKNEQGGVILQAGKFDYPWKHTELTFDNDLQPEGTAETVYIKGKGLLKELRLVAFQLPFNENANGKDGVLYGGQLLATIQTDHWKTVTGAAFYNFNQADAIARSLNRPSNQIGGLELSSTNQLRRDSNGNIIGFASNFNILDLIGEVTYTGNPKYPVTMTFNYARNMSGRLDQLGERNAYWAEVKFGRLKEKGDFELDYTFIRIQQEAVLSVFNLSNILFSTNNRTNRFIASYMLHNQVFARFTALLPKKVNTIGRESRTARVLQFDINYRF